MHYELYLDSLFLLNFGMNLLLLCLVVTAWATLPRGTGCLREPWSERSGICFLFYGKEQPPGSCCFVFCRGQYLCCM